MKYMKLMISSVLMLFVALPGFDLNFFGWFALVPYFILILSTTKKVKKSFVFGTFLGAVVYCFVLIINRESLLIRIGSWILLTILQGVVFGLYGFLIKIIELKNRSVFSRTLLLSLGWIAVEIVTAKMFFGFTIYPGITQYNNRIILPLARYIGLYGVSFLVILSNSCVALFYIAYKNGKTKKLLTDFIIVLLIFVTVIFSGFINIVSIDDSNGEYPESKLKVSLVQANISPFYHRVSESYPEVANDIFEKYMAMTLKAINEHNSKVVVWPETAIHRWIFRLPYYYDKLCTMAKDKNVYLIIGSPDLNEFDEEYNSAFIISPKGELVGKYDKNVLIPIWEGIFISGNKLEPIVTEDFSAGINICFEVLFPHIAATHVSNGADILFVLSDNSIFGYTLIPYITSAFAVFRAVENDVYVVQNMNTGPSKIIGPNGDILAKSSLFQESIISYDFKINKNSGMCYARYGGNFYCLIMLLFLIYMLYDGLNIIIKVGRNN